MGLLRPIPGSGALAIYEDLLKTCGAAQIEKLIERMLADAKERWEKNPHLSAYISGSETE